MDGNVQLLYLCQEDCIKAGGTDMAGTMKAVERSFLLHGTKNYVQPGKPVIRWGGPNTEETRGRIMSMPSYLGPKGPYGPNDTDEHEELTPELQRMLDGLGGPVNTAGIKWIPSKPGNPKKHKLPRANAIIIIVDPDTLMPACIMDGTIVSAMRTGAASGVAAKYLAKKDSEVMGLVGASVQGRTQLMAIKEALPGLRVCKVFDLDMEKSNVFAKEMAEQLDIEIEVCDSARSVFKDADVISTATIAREAYIKPEWYEEGSLHCEISFWDTPAEALKVMDLIVVDDWYQVKHHAVDISWRAVRDGIIPESKIHGDLGEIVAGKKSGRTDDGQRIFFNPIGLGIHDLSEGFRVYQNARAQGIGQELSLWRTPLWY